MHAMEYILKLLCNNICYIAIQLYLVDICTCYLYPVNLLSGMIKCLPKSTSMILLFHLVLCSLCDKNGLGFG